MGQLPRIPIIQNTIEFTGDEYFVCLFFPQA